MRKQFREREIVLFLGAGFSSDAGLPIMRHFGTESKKDYDGLEKHLSKKNYRYAAPMLREAAELYYGFKDFVCKNSPTLNDDDLNNLENIFCIAEVMAESGLDVLKISDTDVKLDSLINNIQLWIWKIYQQLPLVGGADEAIKKNSYIYDKLFFTINNKKLFKNITVITTNYDIVYEYFSWKNGMTCIYPINNAQPITGGDGESKYVEIGFKDVDDKAVICKLHGSINYFTSSKNELFITNDLGNETDIGKSGRWPKDKPSILAVDAIWNIKNKYGVGINPAIIPPSYAKLTRDVWLQEIWKYAFQTISTAKKIIFIGYSMPPSDGFMRALIHGAMAVRKKKICQMCM